MTKTKTGSDWQVQIWVSEVEEWYGWAHGTRDLHASKLDAAKDATDARRKGWKTRIVRVRDE